LPSTKKYAVAFTHWRQVHELRRDACSTPKVDEARAELSNADGVFRIPVFPSPSDEFPQSWHLGEGSSHVLGGAWSSDANLGRCDHDAAGPEDTELEHRRRELQSRPSEHRPILLRRSREIAEGLLLVAESDHYMAHDELL
jgi:hypothetical protein